MIKVLFPFTLLTSLLSADNTAPLPDDLKISLGTYIVANHNTDILFDADGVAGSINLDDVFKMKTRSASFYADGYYRFTPHHRVELSYQGIKSTGTSNYGDVLFQGEPYEIDLSGKVNSSLQLDIIKLLYTYSYYHNDKVELGLSIGIHRTAIDFDLGATVGNGGGTFSITIAPPIPVVGVRFEYSIYPEWDVLYSYDLIGLLTDIDLPDMPNVTGLSGYLTDMNLATEYRFLDNFSLGLGLNYNNINFKLLEKSYNVGIDNNVLGVTAYTSFRY